MSGLALVRWVHVLSVLIWLGEVVTINLVLVPAAAQMEGEPRRRFLAEVFPRVFRLASWLSLFAVGSGLVLLVARFNGYWDQLVTTGPGIALLVGAVLGVTLTTFHFVVEPRLGAMIRKARAEKDDRLAGRVLRLLKIAPVAGLVVLGAAAMLMMYGAQRFV